MICAIVQDADQLAKARSIRLNRITPARHPMPAEELRSLLPALGNKHYFNYGG